MATRLAEAQQAVSGGSYAVAFTSNAAGRDFQLHGIDFASECKSIAESADGNGRVFVGVAALTPSGPKVVLTEPLDSETIAQLSLAYVAHVDAAFTTALQQLGVASSRPHDPVN